MLSFSVKTYPILIVSLAITCAFVLAVAKNKNRRNGIPFILKNFNGKIIHYIYNCNAKFII
jgi:hypothetical protein